MASLSFKHIYKKYAGGVTAVSDFCLEIKDKEFYFIIAAAEESVPMMERTIDGFRGFLDCLEEPKECGTIYGVGAWKVGEINDKPSMHEAYEMGKKV